MIRYSGILALGLLLLAPIGCAPEPEENDTVTDDTVADAPPEHQQAPAANGQGMATARAELTPADASSGISGTVTFTQEHGGVRVVAEVSGLPAGEHGFHIHENGECTAPFESAGGHLDPWDVEHGCPPDSIRHLGDLGNLEVGEDGTGTYDQVVDKISLQDPNHQVAGKALIIHADADDCSTQPTGESGGRLACGVIELTSHGAAGGGSMGDHEQPASDHEQPAADHQQPSDDHDAPAADH